MSIKIPKRILIAPLDWGLGHTTRCISVMRWLQNEGYTILFAGNESQRLFISAIFKNIEIIHLDGYNVVYGAKEGFEKLALLSQVPRLRQTIKKEHEWLQRHIQQIKPDAIISDNRYGLHHSSVPSVIITHQLQVQTGLGGALNRALQKVHYRFLEQFNNVWVPDITGQPNLGGILSHPAHMPRNVGYMGLLSQFEDAGMKDNKEEHLLILLSGPEPQRSMLAGILWPQLQRYNGKVIFVAGSEKAAMPVNIPAHITYYSRISGDVLQHATQHASTVICRSGYSTIMDLIKLGKKAILIPTPGQTEQAYLATHLHTQGIFPHAQQKGFNLEEELNKGILFPYNSPSFQGQYSIYKSVLQEWISAI